MSETYTLITNIANNLSNLFLALAFVYSFVKDDTLYSDNINSLSQLQSNNQNLNQVNMQPINQSSNQIINNTSQSNIQSLNQTTNNIAQNVSNQQFSNVNNNINQ